MIPSDRSSESTPDLPGAGERIDVRFDSTARRRVAVFRGVLLDADLVGTYRGLLGQPDYDYGADDLVDLRGVTRMGVTSAGLRQLMGLFAEADSLGIPTRCAIVAPEDAVYGVSRMWQLMREDYVSEEMSVFRVMGDAEEWLAQGRRRASA